MTDTLYDLYFKGEPEKGITLEQAKLNFSRVFKLRQDKVETLFSGKAAYLKKAVDASTAKKYQSILSQSGIKTYIKITNDIAENKKATKNFAVLPLGVDILTSDEKPKAITSTIDTSSISTSTNYNLLDISSEITPISPPDVSHLEVQTQFDQLTDSKQQPKLNIDVSHIKLAP